MRIQRIGTKAPAILLATSIAVGALFFRPVKAEAAMASKADSAKVITREEAIANYEKECPDFAGRLTGATREYMIAYAAKAKGLTYVAPTKVIDTPTLRVEAREEEATREVKPIVDAGAAGALSDLNGQINRYSDLTASERSELEGKVKENGDAGLISRLKSAKEASGEPAPGNQGASQVAGAGAEEAAPADAQQLAPAEQPTVAGVQPTVENAPAKAAGAGIGALYGQVNLYSDLSEPERAELEKQVMESGNAGLVNYFNQAKANAAPVAKEIEPAKADSAQEQFVELEPIIVEKAKTEPAPPAKVEAAPIPVEATPAAVEPEVEVVTKAPEKDVAVLKDSLQSAITECYSRINMMEEGTFAADSAEIAGAIGKIEAVVGKAFPSGNEWAEYKMRHLKEYFAGACSAISGRNE